MNDIEGFVLNGGASSRMGTPKGALQIGHISLAERSASALRAVCHRVFLVGGEITIEGAVPIPDVSWKGRSEKASILGLRSAILHCASKYAAVLACDMPFVTGEVISRLAAEIEALEADRSDVIIPSDKSGWLQPLCAIYECKRSRIAINEYLETGELQVLELIDRLRPHVLKGVGFVDLENADHLFMNINTRDDLTEAIEILNK